ncbi:MAG: hypothetical protein U9R15_19620 [Chloroflexota bacterium]|nr:hypothetical protein [Chloroflexota bacterium]
MWKAEFSNGDILNSIDKNGKEILFKKILDRLDELKNLSVILKDRVYAVRMVDGRFTTIINGIVTNFFALGIDADILTNIRPIYFINETVHLGTGKNGRAIPQINFVALGFQANLNGQSIKRYLKIFPDDTFVIEDK